MANISLSVFRDYWKNMSDWITGQSASRPQVDARIIGSNLAEQLTDADAVSGSLTFTENVIAIEIYNRDTINDGTFMVNGITILVPKGEVFQASVAGTPSTTITVAGSTSYIVSRYV